MSICIFHEWYSIGHTNGRWRWCQNDRDGAASIVAYSVNSMNKHVAQNIETSGKQKNPAVRQQKSCWQKQKFLLADSRFP